MDVLEDQIRNRVYLSGCSALNKLTDKLKKLSSVLQVTVAIAALVIIVVLVGCEIVKNYEKLHLKKVTQEQMQKVFDVFVGVNKEYIAASDIESLNKSVKIFTDINDEIVTVDVLDVNDKSLIQWGQRSVTDVQSTHVLEKKITIGSEFIGSVIFTQSLDSNQKAIESHISNLSLIMLLLLCMMMVFVAVVLYALILRPLSSIASRLKAYSDGNDDEAELSLISKEFSAISSLVDKLREVTVSRNLLRDEMEVRIHIQFELEKARLHAEKSNSAKSDFLSFMSHEIRTPLTSIIGFSENLLDYNQSMEERLEAIHTIINSSNHLLQLINDVLDISKIEAGRLKTDEIETEIVVLMKEVASIVRALITNKNINFIVQCAKQVPKVVTTDPLRLKQILINVISNAIKFTEHGTVILELNYDTEHNDLSFTIIDTGVGMTSEQKENLFNAYGQADISTARQYGGTGLGLYLSKNLAQRLGGGIHVDSQQGVGTVFTIKVSAGKIGELVVLQEHELNEAVFSNVEKLDAKLSGKVLLADDVLENQKLIAHYVKDMGAEIDIASNGLEAVEMAEANDYDLILMDIRMPIMDGIGAIRQLRAKGNKVPIVSLSANNMSEDQARYLSAGFNASISKPIVRMAFKQVLVTYLKPAASKSGDEAPIYSSLLESEPDFIDIINMFLQRLPELIQKISDSFESGDWALLKEELHRVKGVAGNYGYNDLMKLVAKGEFVATSKDYVAFTALLVEIKAVERRILLAVDK